MGNPNPKNTWAPGKSGNPSGRPKGYKRFREALVDKCEDEVVQVIQDCLRSDSQKLRLEAAKFAVEYMYGRPGIVEADVMAVLYE